MATSVPQASQAWHHALKLRKHLLKQLERLKASSAAGIDVSQFEQVDDLLEKFRLACVHTIFLDFEYAVAENTEEALWASHTSINSEYRRTLSRLKQLSHAAEKRKIEKMYNNFLRIAQKFYKGYIQRLSARFDVPELRRVAEGIEVTQLPADDTISPVPPELNNKVLRSCHSTLLRLGDLARYRIQARHKTTGFETAQTYYTLAHRLMPDSGFAFHQMGIVNLDQGNHMDVVYHFYRAWAVQIPHPNAKPNLEAEFKALQPPNTPKSKNNPPSPHDAFIMWFVRLHAFFYKGEVFQQQAELEGEVMHRLDMAAKSPSSADILLKMALVNMSAYDIASTNYAEQQKPSHLRFCQFTLRFMARFISTFCGTLEISLKEAIAAEQESGSDETDAAKPPASVEYLLPVLRICTMWLAGRRHEVFGATDAFGPVVPAMAHNLAKVFTLLCFKTYNQENLASCPYLLAEDLEIRGLRPLNESHVPEACRCYCGEDGRLKPYLQISQQRFDATGENFARILDILRCAYFLAEDEATPLSYQVVDNCLVFEYQPDKVTYQTMDANGQNAVAETSIDSAPAQEIQHPLTAPALSQSHTDVRKSSRESEYSLPNGVDEAESTVINMLAPFLRPPTPQAQQQQQQQQARVPDETSYGMHTTTANELFASFQPEPSPSRSIPSGKFEPLPWAWFDTPKPHQGQDPTSAASREAFSAPLSPTHSPHSSVAVGRALDDPFATPGRYVSGGFARHSLGEVAMPAASASEDAHRNQLLESFTGGSVGRSSAFSQWAQAQTAARQQKAANQANWAARGGADPVPQSSSVSGFSHPSSLYQGTPMNGAQYGAFAPNNAGHSQQRRSVSQREQGMPARHFQMDNTTSSYNEAILRSAYDGHNAEAAAAAGSSRAVPSPRGQVSNRGSRSRSGKHSTGSHR